MVALNKVKYIVDKILEVLSTATLAVMTVLVVYQVVTRYVFNAPSATSEALSQYLFCWMIMFGSAYVYGSKEHLTIDILKDKFSPRTNMYAELAANICLFVFVLGVCVIGGYLYTTKQAVQFDPSLKISKAILYAALPFSGVITLFYSVYNCFETVDNFKKGQRSFGDELSGTA